METKEDKRQGEQKSQNTVKHLDARGGVDESLGSLGFNSKPSKPQQVEKKESKPEPRGKGGKGKKVVLDEDDFPSLWWWHIDIKQYKYYFFSSLIQNNISIYLTVNKSYKRMKVKIKSILKT